MVKTQETEEIPKILPQIVVESDQDSNNVETIDLTTNDAENNKIEHFTFSENLPTNPMDLDIFEDTVFDKPGETFIFTKML